MRYDVAIVGAGPAGSTAAKILSEKGINTLLLEKTTFPREKPCGGGLQMRVLHRFKYIEEHNLIDSYSTAFQIHTSTMTHHVDFHHTKPLQAMVLRKTFDEGLVTLAVRSGAVLRCGNTVQDMTNHKGAIGLMLSDGTTIESQFVLGADGIWSTIAKKIGMKQECNHIGICVYADTRLGNSISKNSMAKNTACIFICSQTDLRGTVGCSPKKNTSTSGSLSFDKL